MEQLLINISTRLEKFFRDKEDICLALLFGSYAAARVTTESDIDIALLFKTAPDFYGVQAVKDELEVLLKRDVDIAVLNAASPILKMQVLRNGVLIFDRGNNYLSRFTIDTVNQYSDLKMIRKKAEENILKGRIYKVSRILKISMLRFCPILKLYNYAIPSEVYIKGLEIE